MKSMEKLLGICPLQPSLERLCHGEVEKIILADGTIVITGEEHIKHTI